MISLITGASSGIGKDMAFEFADRGFDLILVARSLDRLKEVKNEIIKKYGKCNVEIMKCDVSDIESVKKLYDDVRNKFVNIDVLVNNAGITKDKLMLKLTEEDFEQVLKVNLTGAFNMTQAVLKPMTKARQGAIINMSSVVGLTGNVGQANYAASKAGLIGFSKSVAREVAARNIRVNVIAPGFIESDMTDGLPEKIKEASLAQIPMKRFGNTEEVADVAVFLASQEYVTGQVITIDGGLTMQ